MNYAIRFLLIMSMVIRSVQTQEPAQEPAQEQIIPSMEPAEQKNIKILVVVDRFPWFTKRIITHQITKMIDAGFDVSVYSVSYPDLSANESGMAHDLIEKIYYEDLPPNLSEYDIILCQYGDLGKEFIQIRDQLSLKAKIITCFRGADITATERITEEYYRELFAKGDCFFPVCAYYKYRLEILGCDSSKIVVVPSGIDTQAFKKSERGRPPATIRLISVCRLHEQKGIQYVLQAVAPLMKEYKKVEYFIVGDGYYSATLKDMAKNLNIADKVHFVGWKKEQEIAELLHNMDIFVLPSVTRVDGAQEGIPNAIKEAMVTGLPVIATHHSGNYEIVKHGITGYLVPERDVESLRKTIKYLIENPNRWNKVGKRGRDIILKNFDMHSVNERLVKILKSLINSEVEVP